MDNHALLADVIRELEAADLIIRQLDAMRKEAGLDRPFTLRTGTRGQLLAAAKAVVTVLAAKTPEEQEDALAAAFVRSVVKPVKKRKA